VGAEAEVVAARARGQVGAGEGVGGVAVDGQVRAACRSLQQQVGDARGAAPEALEGLVGVAAARGVVGDDVVEGGGEVGVGVTDVRQVGLVDGELPLVHGGAEWVVVVVAPVVPLLLESPGVPAGSPLSLATRWLLPAGSSLWFLCPWVDTRPARCPSLNFSGALTGLFAGPGLGGRESERWLTGRLG